MLVKGFIADCRYGGETLLALTLSIAIPLIGLITGA